MKQLYKSLSIICTVVLLIGNVLGMPISVTAEETDDNDYEFVATNSLGRILSSALEEPSQDKESKSNIVTVAIDDKMATVELYTSVPAVVVVALYEEESQELLCMGEAQVDVDDKMVSVLIDTGVMPEFYVVKAFLMNETYGALCQPYIGQEYTKAYQEFLQKTTEDFDDELIVNFDEHDETNFAVLQEGAVSVEATQKNTLIYVDEEQGEYIFDNIDKDIISLKPGDVFSYQSEETAIVLLVDRVDIQGNTATIFEREASISDVFTYVKLDEVTAPQEDVMAGGVQGDGVTFLGGEQSESDLIRRRGRSIEQGNTSTQSYQYAVDRQINENAKVTASIKLSVKIETKIYYDVKLFGKDYLYAKFIASVNSSMSVAFTGELKLDDNEVFLFNGQVPVCAGIDIKMKIAPILQASIKVSVSVITATQAGFIYSNDTGLNKINEKNCETSLSVEDKISVKAGLKLDIGFVVVKVVTLSVEILAGGLIEGDVTFPRATANPTNHTCYTCIDGELYGFLGLKAKVEVKLSEKWKWTPVEFATEWQHQICDFYYSLDHKKFGVGDCPYQDFSGLLQQPGETRNITQGHVFMTSFKPLQELQFNSNTAYALKLDIKINQSLGFTTSELMAGLRNGFITLIDSLGRRITVGVFQPVECTLENVRENTWIEMYIPFNRMMATVPPAEGYGPYTQVPLSGSCTVRQVMFGFYNDTFVIDGNYDHYDKGVTVYVRNAKIVKNGAANTMAYSVATAALLQETSAGTIAEQQRTIAFDHAVAGEEYLLAVLADRTLGMTPGNIMLINQCTAIDEHIAFSYTTQENWGDAYALLFGPCDHTIILEDEIESTCAQAGYQRYTCARCGDIYTKEQEMLEHTFGNYVVDREPTVDTLGSTSRHCLICDATTDAKAIPYLKFSGASLTLHDNLTINYKVSKALFEDDGYTNPYVVFFLNGVETKVTDYRLIGDYYVFDFTDIIPHQMNDTIYATLYAVYNGIEYASETREYSVATYCYNTLGKYNSDEYAKLRTLLVDLLNYGAKSQEYMNYRTNSLVNSGLTEEQAAWGTSENRPFQTVQNTAYQPIDNPTVLWKGAGLNLQESVGIRFKITADNAENLMVKIIMGEREYILSSDTFTKADGGYYVFFDKLNAGQMSEPIYLTVYDGDTAVSSTLCYSIESYAYAKQNDENSQLAELVKAMMKYGDAAYAYITPDVVETPDTGENERVGSSDGGCADPWN